MSGEVEIDDLGQLLALAAHDLRNPLATISASVEYVQMMEGQAPVDAALIDVSIAVKELARGLEQLSWIAQWTGGLRPLDPQPGDARMAIEEAVAEVGVAIHAELGDEPLVVLGAGSPLVRLMEILVRNALSFAPSHTVRVSARAEDGHARIEVRDAGSALAPEIRDAAFELSGQSMLKGRRDGRYSRVAGLYAARRLADDLGARLTAGGRDGDAVFEVRLPLCTQHK